MSDNRSLDLEDLISANIYSLSPTESAIFININFALTKTVELWYPTNASHYHYSSWNSSFSFCLFCQNADNTDKMAPLWYMLRKEPCCGQKLSREWHIFHDLSWSVRLWGAAGENKKRLRSVSNRFVSFVMVHGDLLSGTNGKSGEQDGAENDD